MRFRVNRPAHQRQTGGKWRFVALGPASKLTRGKPGIVADGTVGGGHYDPEDAQELRRFVSLGPATKLTLGGGGSVADGSVGGGHYDPESVPADPPTTPPASPSPDPSPAPSPQPAQP